MVTIFYTDISSVDHALYGRLYASADTQRRLRADRYLQFADKVRCIAAGALLRYAVCKRLGPMEFETETDEYGKPYIKDAPGFHFNLSHSGKWVVIACGTRAVGIDVERINASASIEGISGRFFTPDEQAFVFHSSQDQAKRFFEVWTAKESYIKYQGKGLSMGLPSFSVFSVKDVRFYPIPIESDYAMTLCTEDPAYSVVPLSPEALLEI